MARNFRYYEKKRGHRRTGSRIFARAGEAIFFAVLFLVGCAGIVAGIVLLVIPEWRVNQGFVGPHPCIVRTTGIDERTEDGRTLYRPDIKIEYQVNGVNYLPVTYDVHRAYTTKREEAQAAIDQFVKDQSASCWYDPANPGRAVLVRGYQWWLWLVFILPVSFVVIGAGGLVYAIVHWGKSAECQAARAKQTAADRLETKGSASPLPNVPDGSDIESSPGTRLAFRLPLSRSPAWALFGLLLAALLWNGTVTVFAVPAINSHVEGRPDWLLSLFVAVCLAGGIALLACFLRQLLVTTAIGPTLVEISAHPLLPGAEYHLFVSQAGRLRMNSLEVALVCQEEATFRQGTNTRSEAREVFRQPLLHREQFEILPGEPFESECLLSVPAGAMHSFKAAHNEIQWRVVVQGDVADWPEFQRSFPVIVHPSGARRAR